MRLPALQGTSHYYLLLQVWIALTLNCPHPFEGCDSLTPQNLHLCPVPVTLTLGCCSFISDTSYLCPLLQPLTSNSQTSHLHVSPCHLLCLRFPGTIPCSCFLPQIISAFVFLPLAVCEAQAITCSRPLACALFYAQSHFCQATHWSFKPVTTTSPAGL